MKNIFLIIGTRPDAIKMAPIILKFRENKKYRPIVIATAQHRQMLDQVLDVFQLKVDYDLNIMKKNQTLDDVTIEALRGIGQLMDQLEPVMTIVQGDTTTSFIGGLASFYRKIPVAHVEAGLRTYDLFQPFPEEGNRKLLDSIATLLFPPTEKSMENLLKEGVKKEQCFISGNTAIDALLWVKEKYPLITIPEITSITNYQKKRIILVTAHRRENFGKPFLEFIESLKIIADRFEDILLIYPVHLNPNVNDPVREKLSNHPRIVLLNPLNYPDFVSLMNHSTLILSDSGGVQEEAPALGKPVLVLRNVTERPEGVNAGACKIVGMNQEKILDETTRLLTDQKYYNNMAQVRYIYGNGKASEYIFQKAEEYLS